MNFARSFRSPALLTSGLTVLAAAAIPAAVQAQDIDGGVYVTGRAGIALPSDFNLDGVQAPQAPSPGAAGAPANVQTQLGNDFTYAGAIGYKFPVRFLGLFEPSIELEHSRANPDVSGGSFNGGTQTFLGDVDVQSFTVNYQSDLILKDNQRLTPFWGGGIGIADVDSNIQYFPAAATAPTFGVISSDTAFTYQSNIGLRFDLTDTIAIDARARYQRVNGIDLERRFVANGNDAFNANVSGNYETVNFLAGLRYSF